MASPLVRRPSILHATSQGSLSLTVERKPVVQVRPRNIRHIWIITGPAGCGKTSAAEFLHPLLGVPYIEADDVHPAANKAKMAAGIPLCDEDRWEWLEDLRAEAVKKLSDGESGCVVTCSALKRAYRDVIRKAGEEAEDVCVRFIFLSASIEILSERVKRRQILDGHFMGDNMVRSQFNDLEVPDYREPDVLHVDVSGSPESVKQALLFQVKMCMAGFS